MTEFDKLVDVIRALRHPKTGCPWDLEQTHQSLTKYALEEAYEYVEAVELNDHLSMKDELGDLLLQVLLNAVVAEQQSMFSLEEVILNLREKMIRRHPHVFAGERVENIEDVEKNWQQIKAKEKKRDFFDFPKNLPSLSVSHKIGKRCEKINFDWPDKPAVWKKLEEEIIELKQAEENNDKQNIEEELGDVLFTLSQYSRHLGLEAETVLRKANTKFRNRFHKMQQLLRADNITAPSEVELNKYWEKAKLSLSGLL